MNLAIIEITFSISKPKTVRLLENSRLEKVIRGSAGHMRFSSTRRGIKLKAEIVMKRCEWVECVQNNGYRIQR